MTSEESRLVRIEEHMKMQSEYMRETKEFIKSFTNFVTSAEKEFTLLTEKTKNMKSEHETFATKEQVKFLEDTVGRVEKKVIKMQGVAWGFISLVIIAVISSILSDTLK